MNLPNGIRRLNVFASCRRIERLAVSLMTQVHAQRDTLKTAHKWALAQDKLAQAQDSLNQQMATMLQQHELRLHLMERKQGGPSINTAQDPEIIYWQRTKGPEA